MRRKRLEKKNKLNRYKASKEQKAKYEKILSKYIKEKRAAHHKHEEGEAAKTPKVAEKKETKPA